MNKKQESSLQSPYQMIAGRGWLWFFFFKKKRAMVGWHSLIRFLFSYVDISVEIDP